MSNFLTKTKYLNGLQCPKRLWIEEFEPNKVTSISTAQQRIIEQGAEVGTYARQHFPDGVLIEGNVTEAARQTQAAIKNGASCLFEAAFVFDNLLVRCDILQKNSSGSWDLIEVKSAADVKEEHLHDVAFQKYVLTRQGIPVHNTHLMHINRECVYPDLSDLFILEEITSDVELLISEIPQHIDYFGAILADEAEPRISIGKPCIKPVSCPVKDYCWRDVPKHSIFTIPRLHESKITDLVAQGILSIHELPTDYPLTAKQQEYVNTVLNNHVEIDVNGVRNKLGELEYPIHFLDFETLNPAIPRFEGTRPYQQFPFQYSCHIWLQDNTVIHREYLHTDTSDPRRLLLEALLEHIADSGSVIVYNINFERNVLKSLAQTFPEYATAVDSIVSRLWDQLDIFRKYYCHPEFCGSNSIKNVLPVLVPSISYEGLGVQKGDDAQAVWENMIHTTDEHEKQRLIENLKAYCKMDTFAMVEIHKVLTKI